MKLPSGGDGRLGHDLRFGTGDQDPRVDLEVEAPERPVAEYVLEGLTGEPALDQDAQPGPARRRGGLGPSRPVEAADLLYQPPGLDIGDPGGQLGVELPPGLD